MRRIHMNALREHKVGDADMLEAEDGAKALQIAQSEQIDLFLVDWNMPRLNGLQLVQTLRAMEDYRETPIIMITSEAAKYNVVEITFSRDADNRCRVEVRDDGRGIDSLWNLTTPTTATGQGTRVKTRASPRMVHFTAST